MTTVFALLPLLLVLGLLASGRASALVAGLAGLSATLAASAVIVTGQRGGDALAGLVSRVMGGMGSGKEKNLLEGVSAYLDTDRQNRLKRAMRLASAARAAGFAFREMGGV